MIESEWPLPFLSDKICYDDFYERMHDVSVNHVCVSCSCIDHSSTAEIMMNVDVKLLRPLRIDSHEVLFSFACDVKCLDSESIMINKLGLSPSIESSCHMYLCASCHKHLRMKQLLADALINHN